MTQTEQVSAPRVLIVDDDDAVRGMVTATFERRGFNTVAAANVTDALKQITAENFDALITDLHMPNPGDGFAVVTAMRHAQPQALTVLISGYPDLEQAMAAILLEADEILVKPFEVAALVELVRERIKIRTPAIRIEKQRVAEVLHRCSTRIVEDWLAQVKQSKDLNHLSLSDDQRTGHLPKLVEDLIVRLGKSSACRTDDAAIPSTAAVAHGMMRYFQGYTPGMLVHESRILQVTLFGTLQTNLSVLDFSLLLPDVMSIADEVDAQLTQSIDGYMNAMRQSSAA